ncbi:Vitamin K epoxide reductase [Spirosoma linguale DSM 74]|uniref:Vitamin K epoxide reductase n=1 Tax=Spirosoma linguale (strain ATCC 33905 / DSM 74 / LMG 10896 / Claus 1) TaxID=504472 RepID=D2QH71_SPILD|nr:Vitamin K epoxide reductase [Spirosoma linguale DSM 74]
MARLYWLASLLLITGLVLLSIRQNLTWPDCFLLLTKTIGFTLSGLLVAKQLGSKNAFTDRLCRINSKTSCDNVLNSPAAKLWGWLSWADIGLLYFAGGLLTLLVSPLDPKGGVFFPTSRPLLNGLALLAVPYTLFSVYYQARVVRQWCSLCLGVQVILLGEGIIAISERSTLPTVVAPYLLLMTAFLLPIIAWVLIKPVLLTAQKSRREHDELMRFKRNPALFRAMLMQQPQMPPIPADLNPILLGNPNAEHTITVVTNPYCGPCAKTHKDVVKLLDRNNNLNARILFTCDGADGLTTQVAIYTMALAEQGNESVALTDWYEQPEKNVDAWAKKYPVITDAARWVDAANQQRDWCMMAGIVATPTVYIDSYQLPTLYKLDRLQWLINELEPVLDNQQLPV